MTRLRTIANQFWTRPIRVERVAAFRIAIGSLVILDTALSLWPNAAEFFGPRGLFPSELCATIGQQDFRFFNTREQECVTLFQLGHRFLQSGMARLRADMRCLKCLFFFFERFESQFKFCIFSNKPVVVLLRLAENLAALLLCFSKSRLG